MAHTSLNDAAATFDTALRTQLLEVASAAIRAGLRGIRPTAQAADCPPALRAPRASFVTLHLHLKLRGCIGNLEANRPLIDDVAHNAYGAAFEDPRFAPLTEFEFAAVDIHLSVLSPPEPMRFSSEAELLSQLQPHVDGLVLQEGQLRGTFLPSVWEQVPDPRDFLRQLKRKAGLNEDYWSPSIGVKRYTAEEISWIDSRRE